jgi:putative endonuclease
MNALKKHNTNHKGFTAIEKYWELKYVAEFRDKKDAYTLEIQVDKWKIKTRVAELIARRSAHPVLECHRFKFSNSHNR